MARSDTRNRDKAQDGPSVGEIAMMRAMAKIMGRNTRGIDDPADLALEQSIRREGTEIVLPADPDRMSYDSAIDVLTKARDDEETVIAISETIRGAHFADGLVAFTDAMHEVFGFSQAVTIHTFFGPIRPTMVDVDVNYDERRRVVSGRFEIPGVDGYLQTGGTRDGNLTVLEIGGETKKKFSPLVSKLAEVTRRIIRERSIYRGKAFELHFDDAGNISDKAPTFIDVRGQETPIFSRFTEAAIRANILTPIQNTQQVRDLGIPLKRGVLLEGPYGTGKTLVSRQTAQTAVANGWTFITVRDVTHLASALEFARKFQPAVLFSEDIDRSMEGEDRDVAMDKILNTLDGVDSKNADVMVVLTSNHAETINRAMIRPGRLDVVISVEAPDAEAALRLVGVYAGGLLVEGADYSEVGELLKGRAAAVIREAVERAKLYAISKQEPGTAFKLPPDAIAEAAETMGRQLELLDGRAPDPRSAGDEFIDALAERVLLLSGQDPDAILEAKRQLQTHKRVKGIADAVGVR